MLGFTSKIILKIVIADRIFGATNLSSHMRVCVILLSLLMHVHLKASIPAGDRTPLKNSFSETVMSNFILPNEKISVEGIIAL